MSNEKLIAKLLMLEVQLAKEANTARGETKKTTKEYNATLEDLCSRLSLDIEEIRKHYFPC